MRIILALVLACVLSPGRAEASSSDRLAPSAGVVLHLEVSRPDPAACRGARAEVRRIERRRSPVSTTSIYGAGLVALSVVLGAAMFNRGFRSGL